MLLINPRGGGNIGLDEIVAWSRDAIGRPGEGERASAGDVLLALILLVRIAFDVLRAHADGEPTLRR